ncbi:type I restriction enzyme endonuclease domain-containing protein [Microbacterium sp. 1P10UB]
MRAATRTKVRRLLVKYDYPPDAVAKAIKLVLEQAEVLVREENS